MTFADVILYGVVGSQAYGLAHEDSDVDRLGIFAAPTLDVAGLNWSTALESRVTTNPDVALHEVGKACRLLLGCNPTLTELLWLPKYETLHRSGQMLVDHRQAFLSTNAVLAAYGGYARQQAARFRDRNDGSSSSNTRRRTTKHARHMIRLLKQGAHLMTTGTLSVHVGNPAPYAAVEGMSPDELMGVFGVYDRALQAAAARSVLPDAPDRETVHTVLQHIRLRHLHDIGDPS